ncbi:flagellar export chaperone FliS [Advenella sp. WQ 585]|uniref:Flagellar export chaperone FliS n=1 Tax=Advenella mandrilli TaxID=2800330 RepID=A0ABS1EER7_9BURK|nr:flagellar export chaperone FliS [Advenella mandrilli]MBK1781568.1 flagellar export chaperone FliS [Advenella mandrilli]
MMNTTNVANGQNPVKAYAKVGLETQVLTASPEELITIMLEATQSCVMKARLYFQNGDIAKRGENISKAISIIDSGLIPGINESAGEVAKNMILSFRLMSQHLLLASVNQQESHLDVVEKMLVDITDAWKTATGNKPLK